MIFFPFFRLRLSANSLVKVVRTGEPSQVYFSHSHDVLSARGLRSREKSTLLVSEQMFVWTSEHSHTPNSPPMDPHLPPNVNNDAIPVSLWSKTEER